MKRYTLLVISLIFMTNQIYTQDIDNKLGSGGNYNINDSGGNLLFRVQEDKGAMFAGSAYGTGTIPATGAGTRMMWYPKKSAFRVGTIDPYFSPQDATQWDDSNIGKYSIAMGVNTKASHLFSTAIGFKAMALGDYSTAIGDSTTALNSGSTAMGDGTTASGIASTAMGISTTASGNYSTAMGHSTSAIGEKSTAMGFGTSASGTHSTAMGAFTTASETASTATGHGTTASGIASTAMGIFTTASGDYSTAMGQGTVANQYATAVGRYNYDSGNRLFSVGNGTSNDLRSDAFVVTADETVGVFQTNPQSSLHIGGDYIQIPTITGSAPPATDCDEDIEAGRMIIRTDGPPDCYICTGSGGWVAK